MSTQGGTCSEDVRAQETGHPYYKPMDKDVCRSAIEEIKIFYPEAKGCLDNGKTLNDRPKGCFLHVPDNCVHWKPLPSGKPNEQDVQICSRKVKSFNRAPKHLNYI